MARSERHLNKAGGGEEREAELPKLKGKKNLGLAYTACGKCMCGAYALTDVTGENHP